jgi:hypothetical protein
MQIAVVDAAQRHGELVTDLAPQRAPLPKPDVMGIGRPSAADQTGCCRAIGSRPNLGSFSHCSTPTVHAPACSGGLFFRAMLSYPPVMSGR